MDKFFIFPDGTPISKMEVVSDMSEFLKQAFLIQVPPMISEDTNLIDNEIICHGTFPTLMQFKEEMKFTGFEVLVYYLLSYGEALGIAKSKASRFKKLTEEQRLKKNYRNMTLEEKKKYINYGDKVIFSKMELVPEEGKALTGLYGKVKAINDEGVKVIVSSKENEEEFIYDGLDVKFEEIEEVIKEEKKDKK